MEKVSSQPLSLTAMQEKFPQMQFRIASNGTVQKKIGKSWIKTCQHGSVASGCKECGSKAYCEHGRQKCRCADCGGSSRCIHKKEKRACRECGGTRYCIHNIFKTRCKLCKGGSICEHNKARSRCKECGGTEYCEHGRIKYACKDCGGSQICEHNRVRTRCAICGGGSLCEHGLNRPFCIPCKGSQTCKCGKQRVVTDGLCNHCNPNFVFTASGTSKIACTFFDKYEKELGVNIQHKHLCNVKNKWIGAEHRPEQWKRKAVDGYYEDSNGDLVGIEFLGDYYHGHPKFWGDDMKGMNKFSQLHYNVFCDTEMKLQKLKGLGYKVFYIWECDFKKMTPFQTVASILRNFENKLEY